jgi:hypothetical protein
MEALIVSCGEPQLERCLEAVRNQTVPFSGITHVIDISPEYIAINRGIAAIQDEWFMKIDGDMILYENAVEIATGHLDCPETDYILSFRLQDTFLKSTIRGVGVIRTKAIQTVRYPNMLSNDARVGKKMSKLGWTGQRNWEIIGTHFDSPDEFQVFRRFYAQAVKYNDKYCRPLLDNLYEITQNPLYLLAIKAVEFGIKKKFYPTSHDLNFDREMYKEFNETFYNHTSTQQS